MASVTLTVDSYTGNKRDMKTNPQHVAETKKIEEIKNLNIQLCVCSPPTTPPTDVAHTHWPTGNLNILNSWQSRKWSQEASSTETRFLVNKRRSRAARTRSCSGFETTLGFVQLILRKIIWNNPTWDDASLTELTTRLSVSTNRTRIFCTNDGAANVSTRSTVGASRDTVVQWRSAGPWSLIKTSTPTEVIKPRGFDGSRTHGV